MQEGVGLRRVLSRGGIGSDLRESKGDQGRLVGGGKASGDAVYQEKGIAGRGNSICKGPGVQRHMT